MAGLASAMGVKTMLYLDFMLINIEHQHVYKRFLFPLGMKEREGKKLLTTSLALKVKEKFHFKVSEWLERGITAQ